MKRILVFMLFAFSILSAQEKLNIVLKITTTDAKKTIIHNFTSIINQKMAGYFYINKEHTIFDRSKGSFSFIRDLGKLEAFDTRTDNYITTLSDQSFLPLAFLHPYFDQLIDFTITPCQVRNCADSVVLYYKYIKYDKVVGANDNDFTTQNKYNTGNIRIPLDKEIELKAYSEVFPRYKFYIKVSARSEEKTLDAGNYDQTFKTELFNSIGESKIKYSTLDFDVKYFNSLISADIYKSQQQNSLIRVENTGIGKSSLIKFKKDYELKQLTPVLKKNKLNYKILEDTCLVDIGNKAIYIVKFEFPFVLKDEEKKNEYNKYTTYEKILKSTYEVIIVPISYENDELTVDLFIKWEKLNIGDFLQRWTPIKKRIVINYVNSWNVYFNLPKEKWTANFTRDGQNYDISGYYDYEKYIDETLNIVFKNITKEK